MKKSRWSAREITLTAAMTAVVFLLTFVPKIPIPLGYAHLGDAGILVLLCLAGRREALIAACAGSMLADLMGGFPLWIGPTLLIKWAMAETFLHIANRADPHFLLAPRTLLALTLACLVMAGGYTAFGVILYDNLAAGLASAPGLLAEGAVNILAFYGAINPLEKWIK
ncbi:MAG: ECF transporter S component [Selenomonas sp.]|nr:ECF transporter S component [Selenomonas sp.]